MLGGVSAAQQYLAECIASDYGVYLFLSFAVRDERIAGAVASTVMTLVALLHVDRAKT